MWSKPQEISQYKSAGFEIAAYFGNGATARGAIANWKKSAGHNEVMINQGSWKKMNWQAVGVGIEGNYAVIWFGAEQDPDQTKLETCDKI